MTYLVRRSALALGSLLLASTGPACTNAPGETDAIPDVDPVTGDLATEVKLPTTDPYDPDSTACASTSAVKQTQKHVSAIAGAFMSGSWSNKYMTLNPCTGPSGDAQEINFQMAWLAGKFTDNSLWFEEGTESATVCGLTVAKKPVRSQVHMVGGVPIHTDIHAAIEDLGRELNKCWGTGHRAFLHLGTQVAQRVWIDPEPVRLTQNLSGGTGATAAAVFVNNSTTSTSAIKWFSDGGSGSISGGTACTTSSAAANTTLLKQIVVRPSGIRECL